MTLNGWLQIAFFLLLILAVTKPLGVFMARVFNREHTFLDPVLRPIERLIYRITGVDEEHEMRWTEYAVAMLLFSVVSDAAAVSDPARAGILAVQSAEACSRRRRTWRSIRPRRSPRTPTGRPTRGETTMSYFTQMAGLAYHNFVSAAIGIALAIAFIRGIARREMKTIGNFWVDMIRATLWVLLPFCIVGALVLVSQGVVQNLKPYDTVKIVEPQQVPHLGADGKPAVDADGKPVMDTVTDQTIAQGPVASQEFIKEFGTNGGGFFNANSAHPFENPTPLSNLIEMFAIFAISAGLTYTLGRMTGSQRHGWAVWAAMAVLFLAGVTVAYWAEARGNPLSARRGSARERDAAGRQHGRQGSPLRHRQYRALGHGHHGHQLRRRQRLARFVHSAGRHGSAGQHHAGRGHLRRCRLRHVRHDDLRRADGVHRRPDGGTNAGVSGQEDRSLRREDGDAVGARLSADHPDLRRRFRRSHGFGTSSISNPGPHGLSQILYAFTSQAGEQRLGLRRAERATRPGTTSRGGITMLVGRFLMIIPMLAIAGNLAQKKYVPPSLGTFPGDHAAVHRAADWRHPHRGRADVLPGAQPGTDS